MGHVRIINGQTKHPLQRFMTVLGVCLTVLVSVIILFSYENPSLTGYSVFSGVYGGASPFVIVFLLLVIIYMYFRLQKE